MTRLLSFDIGIKNLAYCLMSLGDDGIVHIEEWNVVNVFDDCEGGGDNVNVKKVSLGDIAERLITTLYILFDNENLDITAVLLENQPVQKNPTMKSVQIIIYTTFYQMKLINNRKIGEVVFISATSKNNLYKHITSFQELDQARQIEQSYKRNKKCGIIMCRYFLDSLSNNQMLEVFDTHRKKDDLADAYLQGIHYFNSKKLLNLNKDKDKDKSK